MFGAGRGPVRGFRERAPRVYSRRVTRTTHNEGTILLYFSFLPAKSSYLHEKLSDCGVGRLCDTYRRAWPLQYSRMAALAETPIGPRLLHALSDTLENNNAGTLDSA